MARNWETSLSAKQRQRYLGAGRTGTLTGTPNMTPAQVRAFYEGGGDLRRGRGEHKRTEPLTPRNQAPQDVIDRSVRGEQTDRDRQRLRSWRQSNRSPSWLPKSVAVMGDDTAAVLSQIGRNPRDWKDVDIAPERDAAGEPTGRFVMTVTMRRGYPVTVVLQDQGSVVEVGTLVNQYSRQGMAKSEGERKRLRAQWKTRAGRVPSMSMNVTGTDRALRKAAKK